MGGGEELFQGYIRRSAGITLSAWIAYRVSGAQSARIEQHTASSFHSPEDGIAQRERVWKSAFIVVSRGRGQDCAAQEGGSAASPCTDCRTSTGKQSRGTAAGYSSVCAYSIVY
ncbi:predicted protein [Histoplasma capsulatum G186AR]|uniref:Uncharacterized protein n=1 Tax=Ajellomyces capsulatus (strain G186AR / H82 / ATCC MYA-2454 / RMSCC 2432) TaxID=447093 RepID=C0NAI4_AJECG|nr:uncharacterized protein HCBG_00130 [Histoplasma capsulatum G186AR]EEH10675.1 predicted protein [Histoplasma capsulatum G186AR]